MNKLNELICNTPMPKVAKVTQKFNSTEISDVSKYLKEELKKIEEDIKKGSRIAITAGSRGIASYNELIKTTVEFVKYNEAIPIIIPAMGSHGGATAEGQTALLKKYGITSEEIGADILSSMEVNEIGKTDTGLSVFIDRYACECDGIILLNRIKPHTSFRGTFESGILKMLAIGLAKQKGADSTHSLRFERMAENIIKVGKVALSNLNIICGIGIIENGYHAVSEIEVLKPDEILTREPILLERARNNMARIYLDRIDGLVVNIMGKEISGTGMDTNIVGRVTLDGIVNDPTVVQLGVLDLTEKSDGNATGMGYADFISKKLKEKIDFENTYINTITSTARGSTKMPPVMDTDRLVVQAIVKTCGQIKLEDKRIVLINSTAELAEIYMSQAAIEAITYPEKIAQIGQLENINFDENDNLDMF